MKSEKKKLYLQQKRRYLKRISGTTLKPRLSVFRSHRNIYAQIINDETKQTIVSSSTLHKSIREQIGKSGATKEAAYLIGINLGEKAKEKKIESVVFDRGGRPYHGRIAAVAKGARACGINM